MTDALVLSWRRHLNCFRRNYTRSSDDVTVDGHVKKCGKGAARVGVYIFTSVRTIFVLSASKNYNLSTQIFDKISQYSTPTGGGRCKAVHTPLAGSDMAFRASLVRE